MSINDSREIPEGDASSAKRATPVDHAASTEALRIPGQGKGRWRVARDFDALSPELLADFEGDR